MYGGTSTVVGALLNYFLRGATHPAILFSGLALVLLGICLLGFSQQLKSWRLRADAFTQHGDGSSKKAALLDTTTGEHSHTEPTSDIDGSCGRPKKEGGSCKKKRLNPATAVALCLGAGLCSSLWSPLSTYADLPNPYLCLVVFAAGEVCSIPSVVLLAACFDSLGSGGSSSSSSSMHDNATALTAKARTTLLLAGIRGEFRTLTHHRFAWAWLCGAVVGTGYISYFLSSQLLPVNVAFGLATCNPILALLMGACLGEFHGSSKNEVFVMVLAVVTYLSAIGVLASIA
jgi:drug/metabolite transporter (DMT)-like permease